MSDHRRYLEYVVSQDPRGQAKQLVGVRNKYRRDGEKSLPTARKQLQLNKTRPPIPIEIDASAPQSQLPPALPGHMPASKLEGELDALARDLVLSEDTAELRRRIADFQSRADQADAQRLRRFGMFLSCRSTVRQLGRETPYWQPMLDELVGIWLAPAHQLEALRGDLVSRRLMLLSREGIQKLFDALRLNTPDLVREESYLFERLLNPNQGTSQSPVADRMVSTLPNLDRSSKCNQSSGGFRWYHFVMIYFALKFFFIIASSFFK